MILDFNEKKGYSEDFVCAPHDEITITLKVSVFGRLRLDFTPLEVDSFLFSDSEVDDLPS